MPLTQQRKNTREVMNRLYHLSLSSNVPRAVLLFFDCSVVKLVVLATLEYVPFVALVKVSVVVNSTFSLAVLEKYGIPEEL